MATLKRVLAALAIIVAILVAFVSIGGVAGTWIINDVLTRSAERVLVGTERALDVTSEGLNRVDTRLEGARVSVNTVEDAAKQMGDSVTETNFALALIEKTVGEELFPRVDAASETIGVIRASVIALNNTLEAANELPFVSVPTLTDELQAVTDRVSEIRLEIDELKTEIADAKAGAVGSVVDAVTQRTTAIDDGLASVQGLVSEYDVKVTTARAEVTSLKSKVATGLDVVAAIFSLWFVWVAISQIAVVAVSWSHLRGAKEAVDAELDLSMLEPLPSPPEVVSTQVPVDKGGLGLIEEPEAPSQSDQA